MLLFSIVDTFTGGGSIRASDAAVLEIARELNAERTRHSKQMGKHKI